MERMEQARGVSGERSKVTGCEGASLLAGLSQCDVRMEKIAALQAKIAAGTYRVPAEELADCLLREMGLRTVCGERRDSEN